MKIVAASSSIPSMTRDEAEKFLESKLTLSLQPLMKKVSPISNPSGFTMIRTKVNS